MMNRIGLHDEVWVAHRNRGSGDRQAVVPVPAQRAAVRAVRRFGGRDGGALLEGATVVAGWPVPAGREHPPRPRGNRARPASPTPPSPPEAPHHLPVESTSRRAHPPGDPTSRLRPPPGCVHLPVASTSGSADQPVCSDTMQAGSMVLLLATARGAVGRSGAEGGGAVAELVLLA
jgi:hypothetical protein